MSNGGNFSGFLRVFLGALRSLRTSLVREGARIKSDLFIAIDHYLNDCWALVVRRGLFRSNHGQKWGINGGHIGLRRA